MSKAFNKDVEMKKNGKCYPTYGLFGGGPYSEIEYLSSPITPKENYKRFMNKGDYYWIPDVFSDFLKFQLRLFPIILQLVMKVGWIVLALPGCPWKMDCRPWYHREIRN